MVDRRFWIGDTRELGEVGSCAKLRVRRLCAQGEENGYWPNGQGALTMYEFGCWELRGWGLLAA
jgi:hypothetical protein